MKHLLDKYIPAYQDDYYRPTLHSYKGKYDHENFHLFSAIFCKLISLVSIDDAASYTEYYQRTIIPKCKGEVFGTYHRQPDNSGYYPEKHPEFKKTVWNRISRDEAVGLYYLADFETKKILRAVAQANMPFDDFGVYDKRYRLPLTVRWELIKGCGGKTTILMNAAWWLDHIYDKIMIKFFRWAPWKKRIADTVCKDLVRINKNHKPEIVQWALELYFGEEHPFSKMVRRV